MHNLSIIVPCYNEEPNFVMHTINSYADYCVNTLKQDFEIIIVENGSNKLEIMEKSKNDNETFRFLFNEKKGLGGALKIGILASLSPILIWLPADMSYNTIFIENSYNLINNTDVDMVLGSKFLKQSIVRRTRTSNIISWVYNKILNAPVVSDYTGTKAWKKSAILPLLDKCPSNGIEFEVQLIQQAIKSGLKITETPVIVNDIRKRGMRQWIRTKE